MNKKKILLVSSGMIVIGSYLLYRYFSNRPQPAVLQKSSATTKADWNKLLSKGTTGIEVGILQKALKKLDVDGNFDQKTEDRLISVIGLKSVTLTQYNELLKKKKNGK